MALHIPDGDSNLGAEGGIGEQYQGVECCWPWRDSLRGQEGEHLWWEVLSQESQTATGQGATAESGAVDAAITDSSLSPHTGPGS